MNRKLTATVMVAAAFALTAASCGGATGRAASTTAATSLVIRATNGVAGTAVFTLRCDPAGGTVPDAGRACARLSELPPSRLLAPKGYLCPGTALSPWDVRITGHRDGRPVQVDMPTCWTPQVPVIRALGISWSQVIDAARPAR
jgi:hypothetical protein